MKFSWQEYWRGLPCAVYKRCCCLVAKSCPTLLQPHGLQLSRLLCPWHIPGKNTGVGCHFLLQGLIFLKDHWLLCWEVMEVGGGQESGHTKTWWSCLWFITRNTNSKLKSGWPLASHNCPVLETRWLHRLAPTHLSSPHKRPLLAVIRTEGLWLTDFRA